MPGQTNPRPAPIPPQPRHTLHTLCLHAMCRPIAHHETAQDRLRLDSTAASPVTGQLAHHPACHPTYPTPRCHLNSTLLCCPALRHFDQPTASENGHGISTHLCPYSSTLQLYSLVLSLTLSNLTTTMCAAMPSQTNPTPAPIPPQPRHTLHTLCLHAMCRPIAHHEIVQDRLRLDSTAASPVTDNWLTTEPATLHIHTPRCQINSTLLCCPALLHFDRPTASVNGHGISTHLGPHSSTLQLYNSTLLCCHSLSQISQQQCALSCPAQPCHTRAREAITSKTHASHAVPPCHVPPNCLP